MPKYRVYYLDPKMTEPEYGYWKEQQSYFGPYRKLRRP